MMALNKKMSPYLAGIKISLLKHVQVDNTRYIGFVNKVCSGPIPYRRKGGNSGQKWCPTVYSSSWLERLSVPASRLDAGLGFEQFFEAFDWEWSS